jgi:hypothetical protein
VSGWAAKATEMTAPRFALATLRQTIDVAALHCTRGTLADARSGLELFRSEALNVAIKAAVYAPKSRDALLSASNSRYSPTNSVQYFLPDGEVAEARP